MGTGRTDKDVICKPDSGAATWENWGGGAHKPRQQSFQGFEGTQWPKQAGIWRGYQGGEETYKQKDLGSRRNKTGCAVGGDFGVIESKKGGLVRGGKWGCGNRRSWTGPKKVKKMRGMSLEMEKLDCMRAGKAGGLNSLHCPSRDLCLGTKRKRKCGRTRASSRV